MVSLSDFFINQRLYLGCCVFQHKFQLNTNIFEMKFLLKQTYQHSPSVLSFSIVVKCKTENGQQS